MRNSTPSGPIARWSLGMSPARNPSPVATTQSCVSWQRSGVIHANVGRALPARSAPSCVSGTTWEQRAALPATSSKYRNGSCFFAYSPEEGPW